MKSLTSEATTNILDMWETHKVLLKQGKNPNNYGWKFPGKNEQRDYLLKLGLITQNRNCACDVFKLSKAGMAEARLLNKLGFNSRIRARAESALAGRK